MTGSTQADITVIGGGIAGCSVALHAALAGARVVLLEGKEIGWGASSRNSGHVPPATKQSPAELLRMYGPRHGPRLIEAARSGPELVFALAETNAMNADVARTGNIVAAHTVAALETLRTRAADLQARGYPAEILDRQQAVAFIGSDYYFGCLLDRAGGTINPLAYVRGLARAAGTAGAEIHEGSPATSLDRTSGKWRTETGSGAVVSDFVVLCTKAYTSDLWPGLKQTVVPVRAYQYLTKPLSDGMRAAILPGRQGMTDTRRLMSGIRMMPDGRMLFSGQGAPFGAEGEPEFGPSLKRIQSIFPQMGKIELEYWWTGWLAMNFENAWKIHELAPGLLSALGCNGRGVALATIFGRELARYMRGTPADDLVIPFAPLKPIAVHAIHPPLVKSLMTYYRLRDAIDVRRARPVRRPT
ncbi:MAG: FAD-dependent oxidoreductase [Betaproteobacteria bacterium]